MKFDISPLSFYQAIRTGTKELTKPLSEADQTIQSMTEASPVKWHLAHTSWFFETFILQDHQPDYKVFHTGYDALFNSYYYALGQPFDRSRRGLITRPDLSEILSYRAYIDEHMENLIEGPDLTEEIRFLILLGLNHEQQHQELILTDIKHAFFQNPSGPEYCLFSDEEPSPSTPPPLTWLEDEGGLCDIGVKDSENFAYDNERPCHKVFLSPYALADRPVVNAEYLEFIEDGGYHTPKLWRSDGWAHLKAQQCEAPAYWRKRDGVWEEWTLYGYRPLQADIPVSHISFYEADAYASWAGARLPLEAEWEHMARQQTCGVEPDHPTHCEAKRYHPGSVQKNIWSGQVWEWTASPYTSYPGFRPFDGKAHEYNGKFMANQMVLRGGSCLTSPGHTRLTYRNFFYPDAFWQVSGFRLAKEIR